MPVIRKVSDPAKIVTDAQMLAELNRQGIDKDFVEFWKDYAAVHPGAKFYRDLKSGKHFMVVSGLPKVDAKGHPIEVGWLESDGRYYAKANTFSCVVDGNEVTVGLGTKQMSFCPQIFLDGVEQSCGEPVLLGIDSDNENYYNNVLEWDYGICKRQLRLIHGALLGRWLFASNPKGEVRVKYNQTGDFKLGLSEYAVNDDEELIPQTALDVAEYPFEVGDSLTTYSTASDGVVSKADSDDWDTTHDAATGTAITAATVTMANEGKFVDPIYTLRRGFTFHDISALGADAIISAVSYFLYGELSVEPDAGYSDLCLFEGTQTDPLELADFDAFQTTLLTAGTYSWEYPMAQDDYTEAVLNATGIALIDAHKTGTVKFCIRVKGDVDDTPPTGQNRQRVWANEKGAGYIPKLIVTYTDPNKTSSDTGSGADAHIALSPISVGETGSGAEVTLEKLLEVLETGVGLDELVELISATPKTGSDTGAGAEAAGILVRLSFETGIGVDEVLSRLFGIFTDTGAGAEALVALSKAYLGSDSGAGVEAVISRLMKLAEAGSGVEVVTDWGGVGREMKLIAYLKLYCDLAVYTRPYCDLVVYTSETKQS